MAVRNPIERISESMRYLLRGPGSSRSSSSSAQIIPFPVEPPPLKTSWAFDAHVFDPMQEASSGGRGRSKGPQAVSLAWDERDAWGLDLASRAWQGLTPQDRKAILLDIYLNNPWCSACVDVIAKRICSGGFVIEKIDEEAKDNQAHYDALHEFCLRVNDDWDLLQYVRASITAELIYGECFTEIVWQAGKPYQLYNIDCLTMGYEADRIGHITRYKQQLSSTSAVNYLDANDIIRWWFPHPRASVDPFSPIERVQDAVLLDKKMVNWSTTFFQKGAKFPFYIEFPGDADEADRYLTWFKQNHTGEKNAHLPMVAWGGAKLVPFGKGAMDVDFLKGQELERTIILTAYHVPPAIVGLIESGNIGGGTGEDQEKSFQYNTCDPIKQGFFEKFNYRITQQGFGITDYRVSTRYADYRNDKDLAEVADKRVRNGTVTINEARQEMGKKPYKDAGDVAIVVASKDIIPVPRFGDMEDEQAQSAQLDIQTKQANIEKLKQPPQLPPALQQPQQQASDDNKNVIKDKQNNAKQTTKTQSATGTGKQSGKDKAESVTTFNTVGIQEESCNGAVDGVEVPVAEEANHTGIMIAFMLDEKTAKQLVIPNGEPAQNLHCTLAYLGDVSEFTGDLDLLKKALDSFASEATIPLEGRVSGVGRFSPSDSSDALSPVIALVDMQGLHHFRDTLVERLHAIGVQVASDFAYTPHITLAYIDPDADMPIIDIKPPVYLNFDQVCLVVADERTYFPLGTLNIQQEAYNPKTGIWEPDDTNQKIESLLAQGYTSATWRNLKPGSGCAEHCLPNDGITVKLGKSFPSGHRLAPAHPHCDCETVFSKDDEDATQTNLKAVKL